MTTYQKKNGPMCWLMTDFSLQVDWFTRSAGDDWVMIGELPGDATRHGGNILSIRKGFAWDGPWPLPRFKFAMRASLVHDALYHLMLSGLLDIKFRKTADDLFRRLCVEDGMPTWLAGVCYWFVRVFGGVRSGRTLSTF